MADPKLEDGYCRLPNEILDAFARLRLSSNEWQVLHFIIRKTLGYSKKVDRIANSQICHATTLHKAVVSRILKKLRAANIVYENGKSIGIQLDYDQWKIELAELLTNESYQNRQQKLAELSTKVDSPLVTQKKKDNIHKTSSLKSGGVYSSRSSTKKINARKQTPTSESEIEESLSQGDREVISVWHSVTGFKLSMKDSAELVANLRTEFPDVDLLAESKAWKARKLSEPLTAKSRESGQIWNWMKMSRRFKADEKAKPTRRVVGDHKKDEYLGPW